MNKIPYKEFVQIMKKAAKNKQYLEGYIVFSNGRTYNVNNTNKAFNGGHILYGCCCNFPEVGVRLDRLMKKDWDIDYCYFGRENNEK